MPFAPGDAVVVSSEAGHVGLAKGSIVAVHDDSVVIACERPFRGVPTRRQAACPPARAPRDDALAARAQQSRGRGDEGARRAESDDAADCELLAPASSVLYRIDRDDLG
jgi:hypothetical protein